MNFKFDYLSARLTDRYNHIRFNEDCEAVTFDKLSGQVTDVAIRKDQRGLDVHGYQVTARTYSGGQYQFAKIVNREQLKVTRVDIAVDLDAGDFPGFEFDANQLGKRLAVKVQNFYLDAKRRIIFHEWSNPLPNGGIAKGFEFGSRASDKQIRIYTKVSPAGQVLRIEFQLRKELARSVWEIIRSNIYSQDLLSQAFFSLESRLIKPGIFNLTYDGSISELDREPDKEPSNREQWILTQVLSACIKEFNESGKDLPKALLKAFEAHFVQIAQSNQEYDKLTERAQRANRLFYDEL